MGRQKLLKIILIFLLFALVESKNIFEYCKSKIPDDTESKDDTDFNKVKEELFETAATSTKKVPTSIIITVSVLGPLLLVAHITLSFTVVKPTSFIL